MVQRKYSMDRDKSAVQVRYSVALVEMSLTLWVSGNCDKQR